MSTTRRQFLGLVLGLAIAAAAAPQARADGVVNVYTYRQPALINPLLEAEQIGEPAGSDHYPVTVRIAVPAGP